MSPHASTSASGNQSAPLQHARQVALQDESASAMLASDEGDTSISDADREAAIKRAAAAMEKHYAEWLVSGCFAAKGDADRAMRLMYLLIQGRSAGQVAAMEAERGLGPVAVAVEVQERTE